MSKYVKLTASQKDEIRRLTQLANRRIKAAERAYSKAGQDVLPREVVGKYQTKESWNTKATPISRSVKFETQEDYRRQLQFLRSFEMEKPGIKEYTSIQREKTAQAIETSLGTDIPDSLQKKIDKLSAPELSQFWKRFSEKASQLGIKYSSQQAMEDTMNELYPEDIEQFEQ